MRFSSKLLLPVFCLVLIAAALKPRPTVYLIGDSTVKNSSGKGDGGMWGWGSFLADHFDTTRVRIENHAIGGRSSRTFLTEGRWDRILATLKPGDYVLMQFGHNDGGAINDTTRARGSIRGIGEETEEIDNMLTKKHEIVHSYGWYMRKYIRDAKAKGATPIVLSLVPRNQWKDGKIVRGKESYAGWAEEVARQEAAPFIDLNERVAVKYDTVGNFDALKKAYFVEDHTHTNGPGARLNAETVTEGIRDLRKVGLRKLLK
ncbi:rhamnogalacturonan acetylesterase [Tellurirhabdus rosea]|uniref:rhamnogalacturonan acetylesterase n=1 Tax=Tellurirhabdus rosea TaxID=2674997 RepID=UPI0022558625|nr:rhamnogalacturonan acetylesterase [Tellurirhabdus rosea]